MFGLMRPLQNSCDSDESQPLNLYRRHRMHYCGTCKTIGLHYGQTARLSLNFDLVFMAELLSALQKQELQTWSSAYQSINQCWDLPLKQEEQPLNLRLAAAINLFLAEIKLRDHIADGEGRWWHRQALKWASPAFQSALQDLKTWGLDENLAYQWAETQIQREQQAQIFEDFASTLQHYAQPTQELCQILFGLAPKMLQLPDDLAQELNQLVGTFGQYIYLMDAWEDLNKDRKKQSFNPILLQFGPNPQQNQLENVRLYLLELQALLLQGLQALALETELAESFAARFLQQSMNKIHALHLPPKAPQPKTTWPQTLQIWWENWREKQLRFNAQARYVLLSLAVFVLPQTSEFYHLEAAQKQAIWQWSLGITALFAGLGLIGKGLIPQGDGRGKEKAKKRGFWASFRAKKEKWKRSLSRINSYDSCCLMGILGIVGGTISWFCLVFCLIDDDTCCNHACAKCFSKSPEPLKFFLFLGYLLFILGFIIALFILLF